MKLTSRLKTTGLAATAALVLATTATAADIEPAVVFDMGGKFDKSFNQGVYDGVERFANETGLKYREFEVTNEAQREQALRRMAQRGANPVLGIGFAQAPALEKVAKEFPDTNFAIIDMVVDLPNVRSIVFKEHEGSFLVGALAAMASESGKVGFVGGMDIPLIRRFACGYEQGAKHVNGDAEVVQNMTGTTPAAWNDPGRGSELTKSQFEGVDSNQNYLHPGTMLTSMLKRVDVAAYNVFMDAKNDDFTAGIQVLGLAEDGVGWALDEHNESIITGEMKAKADELSAMIKSGEIQVHDYTSDNTCKIAG